MSVIVILLLTTKSATAQNEFNYSTAYLTWHYFDDALGNLGIDPFYFSGEVEYVDPGTLLCNRGIGSNQRWSMLFDADSNGIFRYDVSILPSNGWYILQIDGNFKVEMSNDNANWTTVLSATGNYNWTDKGPAKNMSPYYLDLESFLPADYLYVRFSDNTTNDPGGARVLNALITERCYPIFYAGGGEPDSQLYAGDQQFLFRKYQTSDREANGRFADGNWYPTNVFVYKFDLPDDNDDCYLMAQIKNEYTIEISTDWDFSNVFYYAENIPDDLSEQLLKIDLKPLLTQTLDNVIYFRVGDSDPSDGFGGDLKNFWIASQIPALGKTFKPTDEIEAGFLWENYNSKLHGGAQFRFTDLDYFVTYRFNLGKDATDSAYINISTAAEYKFQGSSNGVDWVDLFIGPTDHTTATAQDLVFHPFTGETEGYGAQSGIPCLVSPDFDGRENVFFLKMSDSDPTDGWGGVLKRITITTPPNPDSKLNTIYPVWHYFDVELPGAIGEQYYHYSGTFPQTGPSALYPNRGISSTGRKATFIDGTSSFVMKYPMDPSDTQAWYVLQVDNQYSIELSNDGTTWTTPFTPDPSLLTPSPDTKNLNWFHKGITNMAPYYFDLSPLLPANNIYVKFADAETSGGWGSRAWNALITKRGYPAFFGGGNEPDSSGLWGDQQFLFTKDTTSDRENYGRFADASRRLSYKFDLPDGEDDCTLHTRLNGNFYLWVSTNYMFSTKDIAVSNTTGIVSTNFHLAIPLSNVLAKTDDNLIYVGVGDNTTADGWGGNVMEFWIVNHPVLTQAVVNAATEDELPFIWENTFSQIYITPDGNRTRLVNNHNYFVYLFNINNIIDTESYSFEVENEYKIDVSTNCADWYNIFDAGTSNNTKNIVSYNPYTGTADGHGENPSAPALYVLGQPENEIYFRFHTSNPASGIEALMYKSWTGDAIPEPGTGIWIIGLLATHYIMRMRKRA